MKGTTMTVRTGLVFVLAGALAYGEQPHIQLEKAIPDSTFDPGFSIVVTGAPPLSGSTARIDGIAFAATTQIAQWETLPATAPSYSPPFKQSPRQRVVLESTAVNVRLASIRVRGLQQTSRRDIKFIRSISHGRSHQHNDDDNHCIHRA
ncbi:MAG: hypothetical protein ABSD98_05390 [Candidatus Korobacteraceae bacterium]|jgi:hypothetical protein